MAHGVEEQQTGELVGFNIGFVAKVADEGDDGGLIEVFLQGFQYFKVVLGYLVVVVLPQEAERIDLLAQLGIVDEILEEFEGKFLVLNEVVLALQIFLVHRHAHQSGVCLTVDFIVFHTTPVHSRLFHMLAIVVVVGQFSEEPVVEEAPVGVAVGLGGHELVLGLLHHHTCHLEEVLEHGHLQHTQVVQARDMVLEVFLGHHQVEVVGVGGIGQLQYFRS